MQAGHGDSIGGKSLFMFIVKFMAAKNKALLFCLLKVMTKIFT